MVRQVLSEHAAAWGLSSEAFERLLAHPQVVAAIGAIDRDTGFSSVIIQNAVDTALAADGLERTGSVHQALEMALRAYALGQPAKPKRDAAVQAIRLWADGLCIDKAQLLRCLASARVRTTLSTPGFTAIDLVQAVTGSLENVAVKDRLLLVSALEATVEPL